MKKENLISKLKAQGFPNKIIHAFENVDRSLFVPIDLKNEAYEDTALPIGQGQTISQPYTIAFMLSLLDVESEQDILEIGSGSGYVLALLSELNLSGKIKGFEILQELVFESKKRLEQYKNVEVIQGDVLNNLGSEKFDRILVSASFSEMPQEMINKNLGLKGKMVVPVGNSIYLVEKDSGENKVQEFPGFRFVPIK